MLSDRALILASSPLEKIANDRSYQPLRLAHQLNVDLRFSTRDDLAQAASLLHRSHSG
jgi:hypothetical protein